LETTLDLDFLLGTAVAEALRCAGRPEAVLEAGFVLAAFFEGLVFDLEGVAGERVPFFAA
jgi:hypothetical protein